MMLFLTSRHLHALRMYERCLKLFGIAVSRRKLSFDFKDLSFGRKQSFSRTYSRLCLTDLIGNFLAMVNDRF